VLITFRRPKLAADIADLKSHISATNTVRNMTQIVADRYVHDLSAHTHFHYGGLIIYGGICSVIIPCENMPFVGVYELSPSVLGKGLNKACRTQ
jgi:hypothetical protein